ncbi:MAG: alkanesulfonate monooxygenase SsuD [Candidatus Poriferisodalaceae bacterium]|jgi:alkanesulfonate monooxygenase SsuD/methylene tetrahydromethanopterin reductase-like flavin-dependent oxidoreductase (luciferase family)
MALNPALRFGLFDQVEHPGSGSIADIYRDHIALAVKADSAGFEHYFKSEHHHVPLDAAPSVGVFLAALSQITSRIKLVSLVHLLPFYEPMRLFEELCMLDQLSAGRVEFGFGKGVSPPEHLLWNIDRNEVEARTEESLQIILKAMHQVGNEGLGTLFSFEGKFWTYLDAPLELSPYQTPHPPLWRPGTLATAAKLGVSTFVPGPVEVVLKKIGEHRQLVEPGLCPTQQPILSLLRRVVVASTDKEAEHTARSGWATFDANLTKLFRRYDLWPPHVPSFLGDFDQAVATDSLVFGSPQKVKEHFVHISENIPGGYVTICPSFGDISGFQAQQTLDLFIENVMTDLS